MLLAIFTRSLPFFHRGYCVFFSTIFFLFLSVENFQLKKNSPKKSTATCVLAVAQPPAINFDKVRQKADFNYLLH
jgi:hypothetical protein